MQGAPVHQFTEKIPHTHVGVNNKCCTPNISNFGYWLWVQQFGWSSLKNNTCASLLFLWISLDNCVFQVKHLKISLIFFQSSDVVFHLWITSLSNSQPLPKHLKLKILPSIHLQEYFLSHFYFQTFTYFYLKNLFTSNNREHFSPKYLLGIMVEGRWYTTVFGHVISSCRTRERSMTWATCTAYK